MSDVETGDFCERCEKNSPESFCIRCKRGICSSCWDEEWILCSDCASFKKAVDWDRRQLVRNMSEDIIEGSKKLLNKECESCRILRNHFLTLTKITKNLELELEKEDLLDFKNQVKQLRTALIPLIIDIVVSEKKILDPRAWKRL